MSTQYHPALVLAAKLKAQAVRQQIDNPEELARRFKHDPLGFVMMEWAWGMPGPLEHSIGPDALQKQFLLDLGKHVSGNNFDGHTPVPPVMMSVSSANGTGKSSLGAMIAWWIMITRPMSIGTVTAGNFQQLEERTWADIMYWGRIAKHGSWFDIQKSGIYHKTPEFREKWKCNPKTAKAENAQSFAGQHARTSTSWMLFDESSEVPDPNWKAGYSCMTDGEPIFLAWGQMLKNYGEFYDVTFGRAATRWDTRIWDGRASAFTNKQTIKDWEEDWGEDSDYFRVHVLGLPPRASALQFIGQELVDEARERDHKPLLDEPLVVGYDAANGGLARHMFCFRRGLDAKSIPPISLPGDTPRNVVVAKAAEIMSDRSPGRKVAALFGDQAFGAVILERLRNSGFTNVFEVNFGETSYNKHYLNMRSQMWGDMKEWLRLGAIPDDEKLAQQFFAPGFHDRNGKLVLESKQDMAKRKVKSPDYPDSLCFVENTMVRTLKGTKPIQSLAIGDLVGTPFGYSPVEALWVSTARTLTEASFSNGSKLSGRPEHEIFTFSAGKCRLDALSLTDEVETYSTWRRLLWRLVSLSFIGARSFGFKQAVDTFSPGVRLRRRDFCIGAFTQTQRDLFQKVSMFTTRMITGATASLRILNLSLLPSTAANTCSSGFPIPESLPQRESAWKPLDLWLRSGIVRQKVESGIAKIQDKDGRQEPLQPLSACVADLHLNPSSRPEQAGRSLSIARSLVPTRFSSEPTSPKRGTVLSAANRLWLTVTGRRRVVVTSVQTENVPPTLVYNLTLREHNAYYANGILVFNCLTFARKVAPPPITKPATQMHRGGSLAGFR